MTGKDLTRAPQERSLERSFFSEPFSVLQRDMNDLLEGFWNTNRLPRIFGTQSYAPVDLREDAECFHVTLDMPGFADKDITVALENDTLLLVSAKRETEHEEKGSTWLRRERAQNEIRRTIDLPCQVDAGKVSATLKHGVLSIDAPKSHESLAKRRPIAVKKG